MLALAAQQADIVGVNANLAAGDIGGGSILDVLGSRWRRRSGGSAPQRTTPAGTLRRWSCRWRSGSCTCSPSAAANDAVLDKISRRVGVDAAWIEAAPGVLVGSVQRCTEKLLELRERLGISYVQVARRASHGALDGIAEVVAALAGR